MRKLAVLARRNIAAQPLAVLAVAILLGNPINWKLACLALALVFTSFVLSMLPGIPHSLDNLNDLHKFLRDYRNCTFQTVPLPEYLRELYSRMTGDSEFPDSKTEIEFTKRHLPDQETGYKGKGHVRLIAVTGDGTPTQVEPTAMVAFSNWEGAWIFVRDIPSKMTNLQHFQLLHEFGHAAFNGTYSEALAKGGLISLITATPLVLAVMHWAPAHAGVVVVMLLGCGVTTHVAGKSMLRMSRLIDEVFADVYALERCPATWVTEFPPGELAQHLGNDVKLAEAERRQRVDTLSYNLQRLAEGLHPRIDDTLPILKVHGLARLWAVQDMLLIGAMIWAGYTVQLSGTRIIFAVVLCVLFSWVGLAIRLYTPAVAKRADEILGLGSLSEQDNNLLTQARAGYAKGVKVRRRQETPANRP